MSQTLRTLRQRYDRAVQAYQRADARIERYYAGDRKGTTLIRLERVETRAHRRLCEAKYALSCELRRQGMQAAIPELWSA